MLARVLHVNSETASLYVRILKEQGSKGLLISGESASLQELMNVGAVTVLERQGSKVLVYAPIPEVILRAVLLREVWASDQTKHSLRELVEKTPDADLAKRAQLLPKLLSLIEDDVPNIKTTVGPSKGVRLFHSRDESQAELVNLIMGAQSSIKAVVSPPNLLGEPVWEALTQKMQQGVSYTRITTPYELRRHGAKIFMDEAMSSGEKLYIMRSDEVSEQYYIFDNKVAMFFEPTPDGRFCDVTQVQAFPFLVSAMVDTFDDMLTGAKEATAFSNAVESQRIAYIDACVARLGQDTCGLASDVFDYGSFMTGGTDANRRFDDAIIARAIELGLMERDYDGKAIAAYRLEGIK